MNFDIIGLSGYAQSGKDSVAEVLVNEYGYTRLAFADNIRELLLAVNPTLSDGFKLNFLIRSSGWDSVKVRYPEVRKMLQDVGITGRKLLGPRLWIDGVFDNVLPGERYVITDVRFKNEAQELSFYGGRLWRVERPGVGPVNAHISETDVINAPVDQIIVNGGTLEDLKALIKTRMAYAH
jgi:hypothetical protein